VDSSARTAGGLRKLTDRFEELCARIGRRGILTTADLSIGTLLGVIAFGTGVFGTVMGTFDVVGSGRWPLVLYSAVKVPTLILLTTAMCLPAYYVLNTVAGLRDDFGKSVRAVLAGQAALALALASLSPLTRVAYESGVTHGQAQQFNALMFVLATAAGQVVMLRHYRSIMASNPMAAGRHRAMLWAWLIMYVFTGIQTGWILRPYIGAPGLEVRFFRVNAFTNAYEHFLKMVPWGGG
jgi:hypothetical protein